MKLTLEVTILSVAGHYDAANRVYRKAFPPHEAFEMCAASANYFFRENIARAFMYNIAAYPAGTMVKLTASTTWMPNWPPEPLLHRLLPLKAPDAKKPPNSFTGGFFRNIPGFIFPLRCFLLLTPPSTDPPNYVR